MLLYSLSPLTLLAKIILTWLENLYSTAPVEIPNALVLHGTGLPGFHSGILSVFQPHFSVLAVTLQSTLCNQTVCSM